MSEFTEEVVKDLLELETLKDTMKFRPYLNPELQEVLGKDIPEQMENKGADDKDE
jgi:hypothetical protein